ncbi:MAG: hypothetical protein AABX38_02885 [Candidatus Micrarchaeota archaeon]|mgnify:CR=1 FL=1
MLTRMLTKGKPRQTFTSVVSGLANANILDSTTNLVQVKSRINEEYMFLSRSTIIKELETKYEKLRKLLELARKKEETPSEKKEIGGMQLIEQIRDEKRKRVEILEGKLTLIKQPYQIARNQKEETTNHPMTQILYRAIAELDCVCEDAEKSRTKFFERLGTLYRLIKDVDDKYVEYIGNGINHNTKSREIESEFDTLLSELLEKKFINLEQKQNAMGEIKQFAAVLEFCTYFDHALFNKIRNKMQKEIEGRRKGIAQINKPIRTEDSVAEFLPKAEIKKSETEDKGNEKNKTIENNEDGATVFDLLSKLLGTRESEGLHLGILEREKEEKLEYSWLGKTKKLLSGLIKKGFRILIARIPEFRKGATFLIIDVNDEFDKTKLSHITPKVKPFVLIASIIRREHENYDDIEEEVFHLKTSEIFFKKDLGLDIEKMILKLGSSRALAQSIVDMFKNQYALNYKELFLLRQILDSYRNSIKNRDLNQKEIATRGEVLELLESAIFDNAHMEFIRKYDEQNEVCLELYQRGTICEQKFLDQDEKLRTVNRLFDNGKYVQAVIMLEEIEIELKQIKIVEEKLADNLIKLESKVRFSTKQDENNKLIRILADAEEDLYEERLNSALEIIAEVEEMSFDSIYMDAKSPQTQVLGGRSIVDIDPLVYVEKALEERQNSFAKNTVDTIYDVLSELTESEFYCKRMLRAYNQSSRLSDREKFVILAFSKVYIDNNKDKTISGSAVDTFGQFKGIIDNKNLKGWLGHNLYMKLIERKKAAGDELAGLSVFDSNENDVEITAKRLVECAIN